MRIDYKNPIVKMCCRCLSIRDLKKVLKLPSHDSNHDDGPLDRKAFIIPFFCHDTTATVKFFFSII